MPSKVIRLNSNQLKYLERVLEHDRDYCEENLKHDIDNYIFDFLQNELEICESILMKLQD